MLDIMDSGVYNGDDNTLGLVGKLMQMYGGPKCVQNMKVGEESVGGLVQYSRE